MKKYGLIGKKLGHSLSVPLHEAVFETLGIKAEYSLYEIDEDTALDIKTFMMKNGLDGLNVTIPYKKTVMASLDQISEEAEQMGAVNTLSLKDGKLYGYNTDYYGFLYILEKNGINTEGKTAAVLGTGGASQAVRQALINRDCECIYLVSRKKKAENGSEKVIFTDYDALKGIKGEIIVNTTPVGMFPDTEHSPVDNDVISNFKNAVDVIYNPEKTLFMKKAESLGLKAVGGMDMLVMQGIRSEEIYNRIRLDDKQIKRVFETFRKGL